MAELWPVCCATYVWAVSESFSLWTYIWGRSTPSKPGIVSKDVRTIIIIEGIRIHAGDFILRRSFLACKYMKTMDIAIQNVKPSQQLEEE